MDFHSAREAENDFCLVSSPSAKEDIHFSLTILTEHSREAEVRDDKMSIVIEKNVLGFEVPMNDS